MNRRWHVVVVVPARDEAPTIERSVRSARRAVATLGHRASGDVVVVADSCTDDTEERARRALGADGVAVACHAGRVGCARAMGVLVGLQRAPRGVDLERIWIANTDADTAVPASWLVTQLEFARRGAHGVAGIVRLVGRDASLELRRAFAASYRVERDGTHPHVHGANLGVRADAYFAAGGWADLETGEDHDLWRRLTDHHQRVSTTRSWVHTSARRLGRAPAGFAADLVALEAAPGEAVA